MAGNAPNKTATPSAATVGYEAQLWQMADALRGSLDAAVNSASAGGCFGLA